MSFILDALKKSESDRQRQSGPALFEVKVAPPRTRLPAWAIAIAVLLVGQSRHRAVDAAAAAGAPPPPAARLLAALAAPAAGTRRDGGRTGTVRTGRGHRCPQPTIAAPPPATTAATPARSRRANSRHALTAATRRAAGRGGPGHCQRCESGRLRAGRGADAGGTLGGHVARGTASGVPLYQAGRSHGRSCRSCDSTCMRMRPAPRIASS